MVFLEFLDYQDLDPTNKIHAFLPQLSPKSVLFSLEFLKEDFEFVVVEECKFEH